MRARADPWPSGPAILAAIPALSTVFMAQPDNFSLYQPLVIARALDGRPRAAGVTAAPFALARAARRPRHARPQRRPVRAGGARPRLPLGSLARVAVGRRAAARPSRSRPRSAASAVFVLVMAPWWARQLAVFGSLSPSTTSGKVLFIRDIGEWNSITTPATLDHLLGMGIGPLIATRIGGLDRRGDDLPRRWSAASSSRPTHGRRRLGPAPLDRLRAVLRLRGASCSPSPRSSRRSMCRAGRSSTRPSRSRRTATSSRSRAIVLAVAWIAARRPTWDAATATLRVFGGAAVAFAIGAAVLGSLVGPCAPGATARADSTRRSPPRSTRPAPPPTRPGHVDRRLGHAVLVPATAGSSWSTIRSTRSTTSPAPTTSAGWSSIAPTSSPSVAPILDGAARPAWLGPPVLSRGHAHSTWRSIRVAEPAP